MNIYYNKLIHHKLKAFTNTDPKKSPQIAVSYSYFFPISRDFGLIHIFETLCFDASKKYREIAVS